MVVNLPRNGLATKIPPRVQRRLIQEEKKKKTDRHLRNGRPYLTKKKSVVMITPLERDGAKTKHKRKNTKRNKNKTTIKQQNWKKTSRAPHTIQKNRRINFKVSFGLVSENEAQWQIDLVDLSNISKQKDGNKFILTCIDVI